MGKGTRLLDGIDLIFNKIKLRFGKEIFEGTRSSNPTKRGIKGNGRRRRRRKDSKGTTGRQFARHAFLEAE